MLKCEISKAPDHSPLLDCENIIKIVAKYIQIEIFFNKTTFVIDRIDL